MSVTSENTTENTIENTTENTTEQMHDIIPEGKLNRIKIAGKAVARVGAEELVFFASKTLRQGFKKNRTDYNSEKQQAHDEKVARIVFDALSQLKGIALKAAQMLSMEVEMLPDAMRKELSKAHFQVKPLNRALIRRAFIKGMKKDPEALFQNFEMEPFAAASLGQVHEAVHKNGTSLAVKIQYPGIESTLSSDLNLLKPVFKLLPKSDVYMAVFSEIEERLMEELDYIREAENTQWFYDHLKSQWIEIPETYAELSGTHVLTSKKLEGMHLEQWLAGNPSQKERNHYGQLLADFLDCCLFRLGVVHVDPNPGNFLFRKDQTLGILDFGCIKRLTPYFMELFSQMLDSFTAKDFDAVKQSYEKMGMKYVDGIENDAVANERIMAWIEWFVRPLQTETFSFAENQGYLQEGFEHYHGLKHVFESINANFVFIDRTWLGLFRIVEKIGAEIKMKPDRERLI